jgi:uncharacterized membrane protein YoaK (UPF0700 family)
MDRFDRRRQALAIAIASLAGYVDALGFMSGSRYFVSYMSGNTTRLAVDLATAAPNAVLPALLILGFVAGVAGGAVLANVAGPARKPVLLCLVAALLAGAAVLHAAGWSAIALGAMVTAMGAVNNTFQRDGEAAVGLTYMTGALVKLGQAIGGALSGRRHTGWGAYLLLWCGLFAGGCAGAFMAVRFEPAALWLAACIALVLAGWSWRIVARGFG